MEAIEQLIDLSGLLVIFGAILFYFGRIIADSKVEKYDRTGTIITGFFFTLIYIFIPFTINLFLFHKGWVLVISPIIILIGQLIILGIYVRCNMFIGGLEKYNLQEEYDRRYKARMKQLIKANHIAGKALSTQKDPSKESYRILETIFRFFGRPLILAIVSIALIHSVLSLGFDDPFLVVLNLLFIFLNLTMMAIAYSLSNAYYPESVFTLTDGKKITGKTLKFGEFVHIISQDKIYFINKDNIQIIEQDKMKKNAK